MPRLKNSRARMNASEAAFSPAVGSTPFGRWLMAAREFHGVSLDEVSQRTGLSKGHLSTIENSATAGHGIALATAAKITDSFGMPLWQVLKRISASNNKVRHEP